MDFAIKYSQESKPNKVRCQGTCVNQRGACYYHQCGVELRERFGHMTEFEEFDDWRPLDKAQWTFEKQIRCADAQWRYARRSA